jgi:hypothetical protein
MDSRVYSRWSGLQSKTGAEIEIQDADESSLEDYEVVVFAREIEKTNWGFHNSSDMTLELN